MSQRSRRKGDISRHAAQRIRGWLFWLLFGFSVSTAFTAQTTRQIEHSWLGRIEVDEAGGKRFEKLISKLDLTKEIARGRFVVNGVKPDRLSIFVVSDEYASQIGVNELNASYDRPADAILLNSKSIPTELAKGNVSEWPNGTAFFIFLLFHELGHREVGSTNITRFYYDDAFFSADQMEEDKADEWAIKKVLSLPLSKSEQKLTLMQKIAEDGLRRYFGVRSPIEKVPEQHPSMLYRIGSMYYSSFMVSNSEEEAEKNKDGLTEANEAWRIAMTFENSLEHVYRIADGDTVLDLAKRTNEVAVLTKDLKLSRFPVATLGPDYSQILPTKSRKTVRRYSESGLPNCRRLVFDYLPGFNIQDCESRLVYADDTLFLVAKHDDSAWLFAIDDDHPKLRQVCRNSSLQGSITSIGFDDGKVLLSLRDQDHTLKIVEIDVIDAQVNTANIHTPFDLREPASDLGFRGRSLLLSKRGKEGTDQLWSLNGQSGAKLLVETGGFLWIKCFEYLGIAAFGLDSLSDTLDALGGTTPIHEAPGLELARFESIHRDSKIFAPSQPRFADLAAFPKQLLREEAPLGLFFLSEYENHRGFWSMQYLRTFKGSPVLFLFRPSDSVWGLNGGEMYRAGNCLLQPSAEK